ncbi:MAG: slipin family protein [Verrucomicrobiae bacterium]|nr:slipin family protein [Verrucomicrobiae bacterium]
MIEIITAIIILVIALSAAGAAFRLINESVETITVWDYQTGLHFRHGCFAETLKAGKHRFWGRGHTIFLYDNRITELVVASQEVITADSATLKLSAVAQWKIADALKYHEAAQDPNQALYTRIQLAIRQVIGALELDAIIEQKAGFGETLLNRVRDAALNDFGMAVEAIDIRDVMLGSDLKNVYAGVLTARKQAQAKQEIARGDAAALRTLANAARVLENNPELFRLQYLETLKHASTAGYGNQLIIGVPEELLSNVKRS